jgi:hypothetical protein
MKQKMHTLFAWEFAAALLLCGLSGAELQGVASQLSGCGRMEGGVAAGRDAARQLVGSFPRAGVE